LTDELAELAELAGKRLLLTGGAGVLGYEVVQTILCANETAAAPVRLTRTTTHRAPARCCRRTGPRSNRLLLRAARGRL
jgi:hypothetical protein